MNPADRELLEHLLDLHDEDDRLLHHDADPECPRLSQRERDAFRDMLERDFPLSQKQREWVHEAALRLGVKDGAGREHVLGLVRREAAPRAGAGEEAAVRGDAAAGEAAGEKMTATVQEKRK